MGRPAKYHEEFGREAVTLYRSSDRPRAEVARPGRNLILALGIGLAMSLVLALLLRVPWRSSKPGTAAVPFTSYAREPWHVRLT